MLKINNEQICFTKFKKVILLHAFIGKKNNNKFNTYNPTNL